jgi:hypothetical protein
MKRLSNSFVRTTIGSVLTIIIILSANVSIPILPVFLTNGHWSEDAASHLVQGQISANGVLAIGCACLEKWAAAAGFIVASLLLFWVEWSSG